MWLDAAGSFAHSMFRDRIANDQPVTIRKMSNGEIPRRYFMPCRIAAKLALKAGAVLRPGRNIQFGQITGISRSG